jgi:hypothetical protein
MLIKDLLEISRDFPRGIAREEVELMIRYDGVLTTHPNDNQLILSITIGCYTISVTREEPNNLQLRKKFDAVSTIFDDAGMLVGNDEKIALGTMGHFGRHSDESSRACERREKDVARQYFDQERRVALHGGHACQDAVSCANTVLHQCKPWARPKGNKPHAYLSPHVGFPRFRRA